MNESVWSKSVDMPKFPKLEGDIKTDVLIIGGGMCGILCAYYLGLHGVDYTLVEANRIATGITSNTTAKITSQHGLIYNKLIKSLGVEKARLYLAANENAVKEYQRIAQSIDCDFEFKDAYTYSLSDVTKIEDEISALKVLGFEADFFDELPLPFKIKGAIRFKNQAQFNPLKFIAQISSGLNIYEHTFIRDISAHVALSDNAKITADKIIVATHFPFINTHGAYFIKMYQSRSCVIALENAPQISGMYVDEKQNGMSFRNYKNLLFIGGGDHRTGKNSGGWGELRNFAAKYYPRAKEIAAWATQDCMSLDSIPYIGHYSKNTPNLYVASGFNKWGMSSSMVAASMLSDMVRGKKSPLEALFSPSRSVFTPQLFINGAETIANFIIPTTKRCPHLGCALKWNKFEHTWDCPCHGSRFTENGELIDNPATGGISIEK